MIPVWFVSLLSDESFSFCYSNTIDIKLYGVLRAEGWILNMHVSFKPYFVYGVNNFHTGLRISRYEIISYCLMRILNKIPIEFQPIRVILKHLIVKSHENL